MTLAQLDTDKAYSYADYLAWTFEDRVELIEGKVYRMSPVPDSFHQVLSMNISGQLWSFLKGKNAGFSQLRLTYASRVNQMKIKTY